MLHIQNNLQKRREEKKFYNKQDNLSTIAFGALDFRLLPTVVWFKSRFMAPLIIPLTKSKTLTTEGDTGVNVYLFESYLSYAKIQKEKRCVQVLSQR